MHAQRIKKYGDPHTTRSRASAEETWVEPFLEHLANGATVSGAARAAGISHPRVYQKRGANPAFRARWEAAERRARSRYLSSEELRAVEEIVRSGRPLLARYAARLIREVFDYRGLKDREGRDEGW